MVADTQEKLLAPDKLRFFNQLQNLGDKQLQLINEQAGHLEVKKKTILIDLGDTEDSTLFLLQGQVRLEATDGGQKLIAHNDEAARSPLSHLRPSRYKVTAVTPVSYLKIDNDLLDDLYHSADTFSAFGSSAYNVDESALEETDPPTQLLVNIYGDLNQNRLRIYSWHPISAQVCPLIMQKSVSLQQVADLLMLDPALALKIIKASAHKSMSGIPAQSCQEAVNRLGLSAVQRLAFLNLFTETAAPDSSSFQAAFQHHWERSVTVSALSKILALNFRHTDPGIPALAGLFHNVGALVILGYAPHCDLPMSIGEIEAFMHQYAREVGKVVLSHFGLSHGAVEAVTESQNWMRNSNSNLDADIVLLSRAYTELARKEHRGAPQMSQMPAFSKLKLDQSASAMLTNELKECANSHVEETLLFLSS